jgi:hypothetical protein
MLIFEVHDLDRPMPIFKPLPHRVRGELEIILDLLPDWALMANLMNPKGFFGELKRRSVS